MYLNCYFDGDPRDCPTATYLIIPGCDPDACKAIAGEWFDRVEIVEASGGQSTTTTWPFAVLAPRGA
jgi:hypothetical protein